MTLSLKATCFKTSGRKNKNKIKNLILSTIKYYLDLRPKKKKNSHLRQCFQSTSLCTLSFWLATSHINLGPE